MDYVSGAHKNTHITAQTACASCPQWFPCQHLDFAISTWHHILLLLESQFSCVSLFLLFLFLSVGEQARKFFLQSGLPASVLAEIWWETHTLSHTFERWKFLPLMKKNVMLVDYSLFPSVSRALADMNKDGKMDRLEFSIAMKLIKLKLQGTLLPSTLPIIMKQPPVPAPTLSKPTSSMTNPAYGTSFLSYTVLVRNLTVHKVKFCQKLKHKNNTKINM